MLEWSKTIFLKVLFTYCLLKISQNHLIIPGDSNLQVMDNFNGSTKYIIPIHSKIPPIVNNNYIFIVSKNNLLIALEINSGKIIYSFNIDKKVTIISGREDKMTPVKKAKELHNVINDSNLIIIENVGHMMMIENPAKVTKVLNSLFL